ncbi:FAD-dependent oxidoreductase [Herbiconiux daphne]|uniref:FAD-dependent oxidoreductase n=1 Tax=Herbiconiux daphne TaxID=2970914 RepID=A0ABT2H8B3_9MICO|nr:FAD-dependent oxidoreductase [Herbiconiux daphne]MCS5736142.1 FAD-dependent oxidoreductase [Herbiconiux daphne]
MHGDAATPALERTFSPWRLGALELPHRVITGSMHTGLETLDDGGAALSAYFAERIEGGAALIITGGLAVNAEGSGADDFSRLGDEASDARFAAAAAAVHAAGGLIAAQLFHAGRYALLDGVTDAQGRRVHPVAPSPLPWRAAGAEVPVELDEAGILRTIDDFGRAAARAVDLGFDAVEIMASEGYLINQFCSPVTNQRDDEWGGSAERRRRFAVEVLRAVRRAVGFDVPIIVRMSGADLVPGSSTQDDTDALARALVLAGADALNVGIGWHESSVPTVQAAVPHGVWLRYAEAVARAISLPVSMPAEAATSLADPAAAGRPTDPGALPLTAVPVIASNRLTDLRDAEDVLAGGLITAVALARPFLADAAIVDRSRDGHFDAVNSCIGCNQACLDRSFVKKPVSCLVNPRAGTETRYPLVLTRAPAAFAVVGGGPAGLVAAADLAERGHRVTLFEADARLGGQFTLAARIPTKEDYALTVAHYAARLESLGARIELGHEATADELAGFAGVVVATGVRPRTIDVPGWELPTVLSYERAILEGVPEGRVAIIGGGGIGVDTAKFLVLSHDPAERAREFEQRFALPAPSTWLEGDDLPQRTRVRERRGRHAAESAGMAPRPGRDVTVLRRSGKFGAGMGITSRWVALGELRDAGVQFASDLEYERITPEGVEIVLGDGARQLVPADVVIVCAGQVSHDPLSSQLAARGIRHETVGGALDATRVDAVRATRQGIDASRALAA